MRQCSKQNTGARPPAQIQECLHPRCHQMHRVANTAQITSTPHLPAAAIPFLPPFFPAKSQYGAEKFQVQKVRARVSHLNFAFTKEKDFCFRGRGNKQSRKFPRTQKKRFAMASPSTIGFVEVLEPADRAYYRAQLIDVDGKEYCVK